MQHVRRYCNREREREHADLESLIGVFHTYQFVTYRYRNKQSNVLRCLADEVSKRKFKTQLADTYGAVGRQCRAEGMSTMCHPVLTSGLATFHMFGLAESAVTD